MTKSFVFTNISLKDTIGFLSEEIYIYIYIYNISCSLLVNPSHTDESWEGQNTCVWIYICNIYVYLKCSSNF